MATPVSFFTLVTVKNKKILYSVQIKKISVFRVTSLKILGRLGTHIFFLGKIDFFCILKDISPFKMHKIKISVFWVTV